MVMATATPSPSQTAFMPTAAAAPVGDDVVAVAGWVEVAVSSPSEPEPEPEPEPVERDVGWAELPDRLRDDW